MLGMKGGRQETFGPYRVIADTKIDGLVLRRK
jgi:hypothetical protein